MADGTALFPIDARDKLALRLQNAVNGFVDGPRAAVENADRILEEAIADLTHTLAERRRTLRTTWQPQTAAPTPADPHTPEATPPPPSPTGDTEQLRLTLQDYRETAERLLRL
ncbi:hypothetical protein ABZV77_26900 [Streptomyces sp. NPDC004732]|uniref:hypothetical protein n=1 Tax=Streptomyces sp. NPDC004732 TaxID=3154290 RepID=UPI0033B7156B